MNLTKYITGLFFILTFCACSKSGKKRSFNQSAGRPDKESPVRKHAGKTTVGMTKVNGVYEIPTEVNGVEMSFIFDTGAGIISISETEAIFLYKQGKLTKEDITGSAEFSDANGNISEGTLINLKTVKIGDRILENIQASVVHNLKAPLLFGQSALEKFGKVSIDYQNKEISFE